MRQPRADFYRCTPREFLSLLDGFAASRGAKPGERAKAAPPTKAEMQDWIAKEARGERF